MKREFTSLSPQEALHVAIFIEERNAEIYQQFAELFADFRDPESLEIAQVFAEMSEEERHHGTELQERYFERYGTRAGAITEDDISDFIEVPRLENGDIFAIARSRTSRVPAQKALEVALAAEKAALRYYARLVELTDDEPLRALYVELSSFEGEHTNILERRLAETKRAITGGAES